MDTVIWTNTTYIRLFGQILHIYNTRIRFIFEISIFESEYARPVPGDNVHSLGSPPFIPSFTQIVVNISNGANIQCSNI